MEKAEIYKKAWEKWPQLQWLMVIEECAELQKEVVKIARKGENHVTMGRLAEEVADVELMLEQVRARSAQLNTLIDEIKELKLKRLEKMLDDI